MTAWSVRSRITALVVLAVLALGVVAATFGVAAVEDQLIADELDAAGVEQLQQVEELSAFGFESGFDVEELEDLDEFDEEDFELDDLADGVVVIEGVVIAEEAVENELANLAAGLAEIESAGQMSALVEEVGDDELAVLTYFGAVAIYDTEDKEIVGTVSLADVDLDVVLVTQSSLDALAFSTFEFDFEELFGEDEDVTDNEIDQLLAEAKTSSGDDLVFGTREVDGRTYVVFTDAGDIVRGVDRIASILWAGVPILVVAAGFIAWFLTARALRPVHAITNRVGAISSGNLHERVPEPGTGDEIAELAATMNSMLDRLEVDDTRLRRFVSDASHELRSPVAVLRSEAEVAKRAPEGTTVDALADGVLAESHRLQRIVEDLLVLARGEERQGAGSAGELDVDDIVLAEAGRRRRLPIDTRAVSAGRIVATPEAVSRVVTHLLDNAARHAETTVEVGLTTIGDEVRLWVDDDGPGVPATDRDRVFERFARLDDARTRDRGGAGLGLAVVAESVRAMGGTVSVDDATIGGARFSVRWPMALG
ncbi:MAG: ATP-binding protein [Actinomycetota bacterium]